MQQAVNLEIGGKEITGLTIAVIGDIALFWYCTERPHWQSGEKNYGNRHS